MKKLILILTLILALTFCFVACDNNEGKSEIMDSAVSNNTVSDEEIDTTTDDHSKIKYEDTEFDADMMLCIPTLSYLPTLEFKIENDKMYICGDVCESATYIPNLDIKYENAYHGKLNGEIVYVNYYDVDLTEEEKQFIEIMRKIDRQENCYFIGSCKIAPCLVAYFIEDVWYFVWLTEDNFVYRIDREVNVVGEI